MVNYFVLIDIFVSFKPYSMSEECCTHESWSRVTFLGLYFKLSYFLLMCCFLYGCFYEEDSRPSLWTTTRYNYFLTSVKQKFNFEPINLYTVEKFLSFCSRFSRLKVWHRNSSVNGLLLSYCLVSPSFSIR